MPPEAVPAVLVAGLGVAGGLLELLADPRVRDLRSARTVITGDPGPYTVTAALFSVVAAFTLCGLGVAALLA